jgi:hypothetical protein
VAPQAHMRSIGHRQVWPAPMWVSPRAAAPSVSVFWISTTPCGTSRMSATTEGGDQYRFKAGPTSRIGISRLPVGSGAGGRTAASVLLTARAASFRDPDPPATRAR